MVCIVLYRSSFVYSISEPNQIVKNFLVKIKKIPCTNQYDSFSYGSFVVSLPIIFNWYNLCFSPYIHQSLCLLCAFLCISSSFSSKFSAVNLCNSESECRSFSITSYPPQTSSSSPEDLYQVSPVDYSCALSCWLVVCAGSDAWLAVGCCVGCVIWSAACNKPGEEESTATEDHCRAFGFFHSFSFCHHSSWPRESA